MIFFSFQFFFLIRHQHISHIVLMRLRYILSIIPRFESHNLSLHKGHVIMQHAYALYLYGCHYLFQFGWHFPYNISLRYYMGDIFLFYICPKFIWVEFSDFIMGGIFLWVALSGSPLKKVC